MSSCQDSSWVVRAASQEFHISVSFWYTNTCLPTSANIWKDPLFLLVQFELFLNIFFSSFLFYSRQKDGLGQYRVENPFIMLLILLPGIKCADVPLMRNFCSLPVQAIPDSLIPVKIFSECKSWKSIKYSLIWCTKFAAASTALSWPYYLWLWDKNQRLLKKNTVSVEGELKLELSKFSTLKNTAKGDVLA